MSDELAAERDTNEPGLFVIWAKARHDESEILTDLATRFRLTGVYEIHWTPALVRRNYERFYCDLDVRGVYHEINKGAGPFVAATVIDTRPVHDLRETSRGPRRVNTNFHDAKIDYRERVGHMGLHCSETPAETRRDTLMLGLDSCRSHVREQPATWDGDLEALAIDIAGADGWDSEADLLRVLDASASYVALDAPAASADTVFGGSDDLELLTTDYHTVRTVMNARPRFGSVHSVGGRFSVDVGGRRTSVGIRPIEADFIDPEWARTCLENRALDVHRLHRPAEPDDLATRCYLALTRRRHLTADDRENIQRLAEQVGGEGASTNRTKPIGRMDATEIVDRYLVERGYEWVVPRDPTVAHHVGEPGNRQLQRATRGAVHVATRAAGGAMKTGWLAVRDALVFRAPLLRQLVRRATGKS